MPRYDVEADGEWACFSSITDSFITAFMPLEVYECWRKEEYGKSMISIETANKMTLREALSSLSLNKSDAEIVRNLREVGLMESSINDEDDEDDEATP